MIARCGRHCACRDRSAGPSMFDGRIMPSARSPKPGAMMAPGLPTTCSTICRLRRNQQRSNRSRALESRTGDLERVDHALVEHIAVFTGQSIETVAKWQILHDLDNIVALEPAFSGDPPQRFGQRAAHHLGVPTPSSPGRFSSASGRCACARAVPPPDTIPASIAARVAARASSTRSIRSLSSTLVAPPTLMTATRPVSRAMRASRLSRSVSIRARSRWASSCPTRVFTRWGSPAAPTMVVSYSAR